MHDHTNGVKMADQLVESGVQVGWNTRLVPFGQTYTSAVFAIGFACRVAMAFGGIKPGDYKGNLIYNVSLKLAATEPRYDDWLERHGDLQEADGRYKANFFFTAMDERTKDRVQVGDSFFFTDFSK